MARVVERLQELKREVSKRQTGYAIGPEQTRNSILMRAAKAVAELTSMSFQSNAGSRSDRRNQPGENLETEKDRLIKLLETVSPRRDSP